MFRSEWLWPDDTIHTTCLSTSGVDFAETDENSEIKAKIVKDKWTRERLF